MVISCIGASTAAFERPLRTDKRMSKKAIRAIGQGNGDSIEKGSKWVGSRNAEPIGESSTSRNSGSNRGSAAWNEGASLGHNDRGKCAAKKGSFLLNGWHQAGAAKSCSRLFLWSVQGSGSTFAWQVWIACLRPSYRLKWINMTSNLCLIRVNSKISNLVALFLLSYPCYQCMC